jgi:hypothetical protein
VPLKAGRFPMFSGHELEVRSGFRDRANEQRVEFGRAENGRGDRIVHSWSLIRQAARGFGADSRGMRPPRRVPVPAGSAGGLGGPTSRSDIFLDDVTVSRRHVELRWEKDDFHVASPGHSAASSVSSATAAAKPPRRSRLYPSTDSGIMAEMDAGSELGLRGCLKTVRFGRVAWSWS